MPLDMLHQFGSTHPFDSSDVGMFTLPHTKQTEETLASSVSEPLWHQQPIKQEQFAFLPPEFYPNPYAMDHRRSLPDVSSPAYMPRQRRYTEGVLPMAGEDDEQRRKNFLERNRQGKKKTKKVLI